MKRRKPMKTVDKHVISVGMHLWMLHTNDGGRTWWTQRHKVTAIHDKFSLFQLDGITMLWHHNGPRYFRYKRAADRAAKRCGGIYEVLKLCMAKGGGK